MKYVFYAIGIALIMLTNVLAWGVLFDCTPWTKVGPAILLGYGAGFGAIYVGRGER